MPSSHLDRSLSALLARRRPLLADGAIGTTLFERGLRVEDPPEAWNDTHPDHVLALHRDFVEAGADIVLTNRFGANAARLAPHGLGDAVGSLNRRAAQIARQAAGHVSRPVLVAGSVGPVGIFSSTEAESMFGAQMDALADGGVDLIWIETMSGAEEIRAAARAAAATGLPYVLTASFHAAGRTMAGVTPAAMSAVAAGLVPGPLAIGANCGNGPDDVIVALAALRAAAPEALLVAKANAGLPRREGGAFLYPCGPAAMADYARRARDGGAAIVGGCCGTAPAHLGAMAAALGIGPSAASVRDSTL